MAASKSSNIQQQQHMDRESHKIPAVLRTVFGLHSQSVTSRISNCLHPSPHSSSSSSGLTIRYPPVRWTGRERACLPSSSCSRHLLFINSKPTNKLKSIHSKSCGPSIIINHHPSVQPVYGLLFYYLSHHYWMKWMDGAMNPVNGGAATAAPGGSSFDQMLLGRTVCNTFACDKHPSDSVQQPIV